MGAKLPGFCLVLPLFRRWVQVCPLCGVCQAVGPLIALACLPVVMVAPSSQHLPSLVAPLRAPRRTFLRYAFPPLPAASGKFLPREGWLLPFLPNFPNSQPKLFLPQANEEASTDDAGTSSHPAHHAQQPWPAQQPRRRLLVCPSFPSPQQRHRFSYQFRMLNPQIRFALSRSGPPEQEGKDMADSVD